MNEVLSMQICMSKNPWPCVSLGKRRQVRNELSLGEENDGAFMQRKKKSMLL